MEEISGYLCELYPFVCRFYEWLFVMNGGAVRLETPVPLEGNVDPHLAFLPVTMPCVTRVHRHQQYWQMRDIRHAEMLILVYSCVITKLECTVYAFHEHSSEHTNVYTIDGSCPCMEQFSCCDS